MMVGLFMSIRGFSLSRSMPLPLILVGIDHDQLFDMSHSEKDENKKGGIMNKEVIYTEKAPKPGPYSQAIKYGNLILNL